MDTQKEELKKVLDYFFENLDLNELYLKFSEPIVISENEYRELKGKPDSTNGSENDDVVLDHFVYDDVIVHNDKELKVMIKMNVRYTRDGDKLLISEIMMWREIKGE